MTLTELTPLLTQYRAALDAQIALLHQLRALAARGFEAARLSDDLNEVTDERDRVMTALVTLESEILPVRRTLASARGQLVQLKEFREVVELHREAADLVEEVVRTDDRSRQALRDAELARRAAAEEVERSGSTLAAYRRVVMPSVTSATLVNRRG
jgi:septal ring factor EnvC (AmiA/AmiB activator)